MWEESATSVQNFYKEDRECYLTLGELEGTHATQTFPLNSKYFGGFCFLEWSVGNQVASNNLPHGVQESRGCMQGLVRVG